MNANVRIDNFYNLLKRAGEIATFESADIDTLPIKQNVSLTPNKSNKAIGTTEGTYLYIGEMTFDSVEQQQELIGKTFSREINPKTRFVLLSVAPSPFTEKFGTIQCMLCNDKIDIVSHYERTGYNEFNEPIYEPIYIGKDIDVYTSMAVKEAKNITVGEIDRSITFMTIPVKYPVSPKNTILKGAWVFNDDTKQNEYIKIPYKIDSIDTSLMDEVNGEYFGVLKCYLTEGQE